jgi:hypothetical protein
MNFFFDYIFYRVAKFYFKWDKRNGFTAICAVSMVQSLIIVDILTFTIRLFYERDITHKYSGIARNIGVFIVIFFLIINYLKYYGKYFKYKNYWKEESRNEFYYRGIFVIFSLIIPWIPIILIGVYW